MQVSIRDFQPTDIEDVLNIWSITGMGSKARGDDLNSIQRTLLQGGRLLVMVDEATTKVIGTSWLSVDGRRTYIHHFGIHPDYQGMGLSRGLAKETLRCTKAIGYQVKLEVHKDNIAAIHLYESIGFKYLGDYLVYIIRDLNDINS